MTRELCLHLSFVKYNKGSTIINYGEKNSNAYFVEQGTVRIYVYNEKNSELYFFQEIKQGGAFNFVNSILNHYSLFTVKATSFWKVATIHTNEIKELMRDQEMQDVYELIRAKHM